MQFQARIIPVAASQNMKQRDISKNLKCYQTKPIASTSINCIRESVYIYIYIDIYIGEACMPVCYVSNISIYHEYLQNLSVQISGSRCCPRAPQKKISTAKTVHKRSESAETLSNQMTIAIRKKSKTNSSLRTVVTNPQRRSGKHTNRP